MLMKKENSICVNKLRAILLLEADINAVSKIIFNVHLMTTLELLQLIPSEIIGALHHKSVIHSALNCQFFLDISKLRCNPCAIISADATN